MSAATAPRTPEAPRRPATLARSLVLKIYLFAVAALVILFGGSLAAGRFLMDQGRLEGLQQFGAGQARYVAREVESMLVADAPRPDHLRALARSLGARLVFVPWHRRHAWPPGLEREAVVSVPTGRKGLRAWRYWVRLERGGRRVGALQVEFRRPFFKRAHHPVLAAGTMMLVVGLLTIPPLLLWVILPLRRMEAVAKRLGDGNLDEPVAVDRRDEFGNLLHAFESLRMRILQMLHQRDRLLTDISHELRGPLSRIAVALPLVRAGIGGPHQVSPYLDQIEQDMRSMDSLIGELLAFARGRSPRARQDHALDLQDLAARLVDDRAIVVEHRSQSLALRLDPAPATGDPRLLARAMGNLLDNAIKYTPEGGLLAVSTGVEDGETVFRVQDDGPGIPQEELPHVFEPFYRPDAARSRDAGGTGLGLAIARAVAESHGGRATVRCQPGPGTTAELRLPLRAGAEPVHPGAEPAHPV